MSDEDDLYELTAADRAHMEFRYALADALGQDLGDHNTYETFNWEENPSVERYYNLFTRNPYGRAVVEFPVNTTWRDSPRVVDDEDSRTEDDDDRTEFERALEELVDDLRVWNYTKRADILSGIGEFGILVLEFDDISGADGFSTEATSADSLTGLRPFSQASVEEVTLGGPGSDRWGKPVEYELDLESEDADFETQGPTEVTVHHSRVIHIPADGRLDDEVRGTPRQEPVLNNITDIEKTMGSSAELAYRASDYGLNIDFDTDVNIDSNEDEIDDNLKRWYYGLEPFIKTHGADVNPIGGETIDPQAIIDVNIEAISAAKGFPQSVLKGNETGERATTQDLKEWYGKVSERRSEFVSPVIVRELIDRLVEVGVLPDPQGGEYEVEWDPLAETNEEEIAQIQKLRAEVLETWTGGFPDDLLDRQQQAEYIEEGTLPSELDEVSEDEVPESDLQEQFEQMQEQIPPQGPPEQPPDEAPADDD